MVVFINYNQNCQLSQSSVEASKQFGSNNALLNAKSNFLFYFEFEKKPLIFKFQIFRTIFVLQGSRPTGFKFGALMYKKTSMYYCTKFQCEFLCSR